MLVDAGKLLYGPIIWSWGSFGRLFQGLKIEVRSTHLAELGIAVGAEWERHTKSGEEPRDGELQSEEKGRHLYGLHEERSAVGKAARGLAIQGYSGDGMVGSAERVGSQRVALLCRGETGCVVMTPSEEEGHRRADRGRQERRTSRSRRPGRLKERPAWRLHERAASQREVLFAGLPAAEV
ncbi:hypothetical protein GOP47_0003802 [Adiantum capillus-veneris]|uniref:Uncharacterized protein n=1 Tax=Adiantum capillus-veneris TaxID=13818 RepID=A0A9D4ZM85_ADICA|nr:hypothetical protein GOP47_0003802 [Adiantum capillus-veneris]